MLALFLLLALLLVLVGHAFRLLRWEQFIRIYERPPRGQMLRGMAGGYALNFVLPFHLGDAFRAVYTGRRMKSGIGFALATVIMDRFLDVWFVAFGFIAFRLLGLGGAPVDGAARYYLVFSLLLGLGLVLVVALRDFLKKICLAFCGLFNDTLKLDGMMFFWSLINTFKDLGRVKIGRLVVNTLLMWAAYLGSYTALAAALTVAGEPMQLVDVFGLLFGRNAADFAALLPGGALGTAAPAARWLLLAWFVLPLLAMWAATLLPEGVRGAMNQATQAAPAGESYLNLLPQADEHDRAVFLSRYFGLENKDYVKRFLQMNRGITILEDYSAGIERHDDALHGHAIDVLPQICLWQGRRKAGRAARLAACPARPPAAVRYSAQRGGRRLLLVRHGLQPAGRGDVPLPALEPRGKEPRHPACGAGDAGG